MENLVSSIWEEAAAEMTCDELHSWSLPCWQEGSREFESEVKLLKKRGMGRRRDKIYVLFLIILPWFGW